jgi:hypothetical protein
MKLGAVLPAALTAWITVAMAQPLPGGAYRIGEVPPEWRGAIARGDLVIAALHDTFLRELSAALERHGPAGALQSCHVDVTGAVQRLQAREGVSAGRTSAGLRNAANAPPAWAAPVVKLYAGRRAREVDGIVVDLGNRVGVLRPIVERQVCAPCHGPDDARPAPVKAAIAARYPNDHATGFRDGEIRGWYWVVMPKDQPR